MPQGIYWPSNYQGQAPKPEYNYRPESQASKTVAGGGYNYRPESQAVPLYNAGEVKSFSPMQKVDPGNGGFTNPTTKQGDDTESRYASAIAGYEDLSKMYQSMRPKANGPQVTIGAPPPDQTADDSWRNRLYAERANNARPSTGYQSGPATVSPEKKAIPYPTAPEFKPPEYSPPAEDKGAYAQARREAIAPGLRELREGTREAIQSAQSLDNPNARANFISQSLKGYGRGLEQVAAGAGREARGVQAQKRAEQLDIYRSQYDVKNRAYLENYHNQMTKMATDFATQVSTGIDPNAGKAKKGSYSAGLEYGRKFR